MCLLIFAWQPEAEHPLVVAANRDERLDRPACSLCVLRDTAPRILGGRDDLAGGTWLATNEHGVVVGLTNSPSPGGRDATKRSRGELPLMVAAASSAADGVASLCRTVEPGQYNPAWLLAGDRRALFYVELASDRAPVVRQLAPGLHVLENVPLDQPSLKVDLVRSCMATARSAGGPLSDSVLAVLSDHTLPPGADPETTVVGDASRRAATLACCVHTDDYGTRSAAVVAVPRGADALPEMVVADGPPCTTPFVSARGLWSS
jgi:uncharacterized protein with NRDE domain